MKSTRDQILSLTILWKRWATRAQKGGIRPQPVNSPTNRPTFGLFSLEEKVESFRDLLLTGDRSSSFLSRNRDAAGSPGAISVSKLQPGKLAAEGRRPGSVTTVPVLFRLLLITLVAALAHRFVLPDFCFHYSFTDLGHGGLGHGGAPWYMEDRCMRTTPREGSRLPKIWATKDSTSETQPEHATLQGVAGGSCPLQEASH